MGLGPINSWLLDQTIRPSLLARADDADGTDANLDLCVGQVRDASELALLDGARMGRGGPSERNVTN